MIEAVNSVVANASSLRSGVESVLAARPVAEVAPPVTVGEIVAAEIPKAPYISPYIVIDRNYNRAVLQIRDSDTGDVVQQFPTESRLAQLSRAQQLIQQRQLVQGDTPTPARPEQVASLARQVEKIQPRVPSTDFVSVQQATSSAPANVPAQAAAAFAAGAKSGAPASDGGVSVFA